MPGHLMPTYRRLPVTFVRGEGAVLHDEAGTAYLDALSGIAVTNLGHAQPDVTKAICDQAGTLIHTSNYYGIAWQERLADRLAQVSGLEKAFFCNSGAEANEAAIKLARLHAQRRGIERPAILVMENSFHGRTMATLSATGNRKIQEGFAPLLEGFVRVPFGDLSAIEALAAQRDDLVAVLVEPVQGEGGVRPAQAGYLAGLRALCDRHDWLMMVDEVQAGVGRTGRWFGFQHESVLPDVITLAKGLGNGLPIGATLAAGRAADLFGPGHHGSTFGGNPLVCRAAHAVLEVIERDGLLARAERLGARIRDGLAGALADCDAVREVRGRGLMIGIELDRPCPELIGRALEEERLLINVTAGCVVRLLPPLILSDEQADRVVTAVAGLVKRHVAETD